MTQRQASARFEAELLRLAARIHTLRGEPALASVAGFGALLEALSNPDPHWSGSAASLLRDLHRAYEYIRLHDDNWRPLTVGKKRKVVVRLKDEHVPKGTDPDLVRAMWPLLPFISFFYTRVRSPVWTPAMISARLFEYIFVLLCTQPRRMRPFLHDLTLEVVERRGKKLGGKDPVGVANMVMEGLEARPLPVARYRARSMTVAEAATAVRVYMVGAVRRRMQDALVASAELGVAPSTARRWKKAGHDVSSRDAAKDVRDEMEAKQKHVPEDRFSISMIARVTRRSRTTVRRKVDEMERSHGGVVDRGPDKNETFWLSTAEAQLVISALDQVKRKPAKRATGRKAKSRKA